MAIIQYAGWRCTKCSRGNTSTRKRCHNCGRKKLGTEPQELISHVVKPHHVKQWVRENKQPKKET